MSLADVEPLVRAVLYEGYLLYPYRRSALKNHQRWLFGRLLPRPYCLANEGERWALEIECLVAGSPATSIEVSVRFLQLIDRNERCSGSETVEREIGLATRLDQILNRPLEQGSTISPELQCSITASASECAADLFKLAVKVANLTPLRASADLEQAMSCSMLSTLALLTVEGGELISLIDPPPKWQAFAAGCRNDGAWPVLLGPRPGAAMLCAPYILGDYPQLAPESPGDCYDATEIDELLAMRIQTLTDSEKQEMAAADPHARALLERIEGLSEKQISSLHGRVQFVRPAACGFKPGDRVRLRPQRRADALDILLFGQEATIVAVEHDFENRPHLAVVVDGDPGRDFGAVGLPAHRFYYGIDEVERCDE